MTIALVLLAGLGLASCTAASRPRPAADTPWGLASLRDSANEVV